MCLGVGKKLRGCLVSPASPEKLYDYCVLLCALFLKPSPPVRVAFSPVKRERDHCKSFSNSWPLSLTRVCASISFTENSLNRRVSIERSAICRKSSTLLHSAFLFFCLLQQEKKWVYIEILTLCHLPAIIWTIQAGLFLDLLQFRTLNLLHPPSSHILLLHTYRFLCKTPVTMQQNTKTN